jgi:hypothetical protein
MDITITLSNAEFKSLQYVAVDPIEWVDNAAKNRAREAQQEIVTLYTNRALDEGVTIPSSRDEIVEDAYTRGWIQTLSAQHEAFLAELSANTGGE